MRFETKAIHFAQEPDYSTGAVIRPVYQTSTYQQEAIGKNKGFEYSRTANPTRNSLEELIASLEEAQYGIAFSSGVAATTAVLNLLRPGDHMIAGDDIYGGTFRLIEKIYKPWGIGASYADVDDLDAFASAVKKNTRLIWIETPTNPLLKVADIAQIAKIAKKNEIILAVDNTFASPYFQRPILLGADLVVHSTTKYLSGHSDIVGGAVVTNNAHIHSSVRFYQNAAGAIPGPWDCWLAERGIKTLAVRMRQHEKNALFLANHLKDHPKVHRVYYPGLPDSKYHSLAKKQMDGFGGMISMELKGSFKDVENFVSKLKLFILAESLGGVESLLCYPPRMTHAAFSSAQRKKRGIRDTLLRLSVGIEDKNDLRKDLEDALR
jgi:cystathionine beta-lyase/cystathionine gamma-synthase